MRIFEYVGERDGRPMGAVTLTVKELSYLKTRGYRPREVAELIEFDLRRAGIFPPFEQLYVHDGMMLIGEIGPQFNEVKDWP